MTKLKLTSMSWVDNILAMHFYKQLCLDDAVGTKDVLREGFYSRISVYLETDIKQLTFHNI